PYALDRSQSGVSVTVKLPDGRELAEPDVVVEDLFIVALGDSFASGESNPDRPGQFSAGREMVYEPSLLRAGLASKAPAKRELRARRQRRSVQSQGATAAVHGRRGGRALLRPRFTRIPGRIREGVGTLAEPRLPSLAIRLSVPGGDRACPREPPSRGYARQLHLLGRGGDRGPVSRHGGARGRKRGPRRQGSRAARPVERPHLPRPPLAERELHAADLRAWQHSDF